MASTASSDCTPLLLSQLLEILTVMESLFIRLGGKSHCINILMSNLRGKVAVSGTV